MYDPGTVLAGKYRVEHRLGRGGMGVVLAAEHIELRTKVAVKCLHEAFAGRDDVVKRFLREARAAAQLQSDHVCRVFDVGRLDGGVPYIVMELLTGSDLAKVLRAGPLDAATAIRYVRQACDAIAEAHAARIIHRDLKPGNLFLTRRRDGAPLVKVLDFGVAKAPDEGDWTLTNADAIIGSPAYMAPEQIRASRTADERSDIWSLGVILYELVTGVQPFQGAALGELAIRIATEPYEPLRGVPPGFAAIVARCLDKDPAQRFQQVGELAAALAGCAESASAQLHAAPAVAASTAATSSSPHRRPAVWISATPQMPTAVPPALLYGSDTDAPVSTTLRSASGSMAAARASRGLRRIFVIGGVAAVLIGVGLGVVLGPMSGGREEASPRAGVRVEMPHATAPAAAANAVDPAAAPPAAPAASAPPAVPAPVAMPDVVEPAATAPPPAATGSARPVAGAAPASTAAPIDAGVGSAAVPVPADDAHRRTPPRRPTKSRSKEQIGESRI